MSASSMSIDISVVGAGVGVGSGDGAGGVGGSVGGGGGGGALSVSSTSDDRRGLNGGVEEEGRFAGVSVGGSGAKRVRGSAVLRSIPLSAMSARSTSSAAVAGDALSPSASRLSLGCRCSPGGVKIRRDSSLGVIGSVLMLAKSASSLGMDVGDNIAGGSLCPHKENPGRGPSAEQIQQPYLSLIRE